MNDRLSKASAKRAGIRLFLRTATAVAIVGMGTVVTTPSANADSRCQTTFHTHCGFWGCLEEDQEIFRNYVGGAYVKADRHANLGGGTTHPAVYC
jgi:hypothetical protein